MDEYCDLTLERFIEKLKVDDPEFEMDQIELSESQFRGIVDDIVEKNQKLENTNRETWRLQVREEERKKFQSSWSYRFKAWISAVLAKLRLK